MTAIRHCYKSATDDTTWCGQNVPQPPDVEGLPVCARCHAKVSHHWYDRLVEVLDSTRDLGVGWINAPDSTDQRRTDGGSLVFFVNALRAASGVKR